MTDIKYPLQPIISARAWVLAWLTGIILCLAAGFVSVSMDFSRAEDEFAKKAALIQESLSRRLAALELVLTALVGLHQSSDEVSNVEFSALAEELLPDYPHILTAMSLRTVTAAQRKQLQQTMQDNGYLQFIISELGAGNRYIPAGERPHYLVIDVIEPLEPKIGRRLGYDVQSNPILSIAVQEAVRRGEVVASRPVRLERNKAVVFVFKARYQGRYSPNTERDRVNLLDGAIAVELDPERLLSGLVSTPDNINIGLQFSGAAPDSRLLPVTHTAAPDAGVLAYLPVFSYRRGLDIYGQPALLQIERPASLGDIAFGGLSVVMITAAFIVLVITLAWRNQRIRQYREQEIQETIRQDEERFKDVVENAFDAVVTTDQSGKIITWNRQAEQMFGWRSEEVTGMPIPSGLFSTKTYLEAPPAHFEANEALPFNDHIETLARHRDGASFPVEMAISVAVHAKCIQQIAFIRDIRVRKEQEELLLEAKRAAEAGSRAKSEFLAIMSHEIRTPMNGVLGMIELLLNAGLTQTQHRLAESAHRSVLGLLTLIDDILDFSRIEAGRLELEPIAFDLQELVADVMRVLEGTARSKGIDLVGHLPQFLPRRLIGDATRLRQVMLNLVSNAVKFTEQGRVDVDIGAEPAGTDEILLRCAVHDTGIGIPDDARDRIFQSFTQVDSSTTRRFSGSGLGLAVSRQLVQLMGGDIEVRSEVGVGSTFAFTARFGVNRDVEPAYDKPSSPVSADTVFSGRILVAEDNPVNQQVAEHMLKMMGCDVVVADDGQAAYQAAISGDFDLILMDCHMPKLDGLEAARRIREHEKNSRRVPIVALTADVQKETRARCFSAGMDAYLSKPFTKNRLAQILVDWLPPAAVKIPSPSEAESHS